MNCSYCGEFGFLQRYQHVTSTGVRVTISRCVHCERIPDPAHPFEPAGEDWATLPEYDGPTIKAIVCEVVGCSELATDYHYFAPAYLFEDYNSWPAMNLCRYHHEWWHYKTQTQIET
jgi:hypothetical protein